MVRPLPRENRVQRVACLIERLTGDRDAILQNEMEKRRESETIGQGFFRARFKLRASRHSQALVWSATPAVCITFSTESALLLVMATVAMQLMFASSHSTA